MKFFYIIILTLFFVSGYSQQNMDTIYGNPKSVREKVEFLNSDKQNNRLFQGDGDYGHATIFTPKNISETFQYNWFEMKGCFYINYYKEYLRSGQPKNEIWYDKDGITKRKYKYTYDKNDNLIQEKEVYYNGEYYLTNYAFDYKGQIRSYISIFSDETDSFTYRMFEHDSLERLIKTTSFYDDGYSDAIYNRYNENNKLSRTFRHRPNKWRDNDNGSRTFISDSVGIWNEINRYEYDKSDNLVLKTSFNSETNIPSGKTIYKYDERNNLIYEGYARDTIYAYRNYEYNSKNLKTRYEYEFVKNAKFKEIIDYFYNEEEYLNRIVLTSFDNKTGNKKENKINYKYKFDKKRNWTAITKIVNDEPLYVWTRKIKYYKD